MPFCLFSLTLTLASLWQCLGGGLQRKARERFPVSREFATVCNDRFFHHCFNWTAVGCVGKGDDSLYKLQSRIGHGKFSEVSRGVNKATGQAVAVKFFLHEEFTQERVSREIKVLCALANSDVVVKLIDFVPNWGARRGVNGGKGLPAMVTELVDIDTRDYRSKLTELTEWEIRFFIFELVRGIEQAHSQGIIHKDLKPLNLAFIAAERKLRILDWGSSEFYSPGHKFSRGGGTKGYKAPELVLGSRYLTNAYDMWSVGVLLASTLFRLFPIWNKPVTDRRHFERITRVLGRKGLVLAMRKNSRLVVPKEWHGDIKNGPAIGEGWYQFIDRQNIEFVCEEALDLIDKLVRWDPEERLTASEALAHPYFAPITNCLNSTKSFFTAVDPLTVAMKNHLTTKKLSADQSFGILPWLSPERERYYSLTKKETPPPTPTPTPTQTKKQKQKELKQPKGPKQPKKENRERKEKKHRKRKVTFGKAAEISKAIPDKSKKN